MQLRLNLAFPLLMCLAVAAHCYAGAGAKARQDSAATKQDKATALKEPDERYKADILLVVAHPDDEGAATAYLARAINEGRRVAVVYGTRGSSGANEVGAEQAAALGAIREIEARRALAMLGISNMRSRTSISSLTIWITSGGKPNSSGVNHMACLGFWSSTSSMTQVQSEQH